MIKIWLDEEFELKRLPTISEWLLETDVGTEDIEKVEIEALEDIAILILEEVEVYLGNVATY